MKDRYPHLYEYELLGRKTPEGKDYLANHYEFVLHEISLQVNFLVHRAEKLGGTKKIHKISNE